MKNKKNGFTTIELITTFALTLVIVVLLLQVIVVLKDVYINKVVVNSLRVKQAVMTEKIMDDFDNKNLEGTAGCLGVSNCISFIWEDGTVTELKIDKTKNTFSYADYVTELTGGSSFGNLSVVNSAISEDKQRKFISFNFPIYSTFVKGDYGIHVIYQYNPTKTGINASSFGNTTDGPSLFVLTRDNPVKLGTNQTYNESTMGGYKAFYNNAWNTNPTVKIQYYGINGTSSTEYTTFPAQTTTPLVIIKYTYTAPDGKVYTQTRNVIYTDYAYDYTGSVQTFVAPASGYYKFQAWGAQGGGNNGGKGGYTSGVIKLSAKETIYVYVGQNSNYTSGSCYESNANSTFNGYMQGSCAGGGGATDFRLINGNWNDKNSLVSRIMVAGGGGGYYDGYSGYGGVGGGLIGQSGTGIGTTTGFKAGTGGNQIVSSSTGSQTASFGVAGRSTTIGGGGYYGGDGGYGGQAGGGSSYISGNTGCIAIKSATDTSPKSGCTTGTTDINCSIHYSGKSFTNTTIISGNETMPNHDETSTMVGNTSNGYAKITYIGATNVMKSNESISYAYQGAPQLFTAPVAGYYKLETWGAQGGSIDTTYIGGYGGYSSGIVYLNSLENLYIYVGENKKDLSIGQAGSGNCASVVSGGYSNGGSAHACDYTTAGSGGGATYAVLNNYGFLSNYSSHKTDIIIVSGGGGGAGYNSYYKKGYSGGSGGGTFGTNSSLLSTKFGQGEDGGSYSSAGGGGYYGGLYGSGLYSSTISSGGGSGYIGNSLLISGSTLTKHMTCYNCTTSTDTSTKTNTTTNVSATPIADYAKIGNGYARITYIGTTN